MELETFVGDRAGLRLKIGPDGLVEQIKIRTVRGPFESGGEAKELRFTGELGEFLLLGRSRVLLKIQGPVLGVEVRLWDEGFLQEQFLVNLVLILSSWGTKMG